MPRRQFLADLRKVQNDVLPSGIHELKQSDDDGQFEFLFAFDDDQDAASATQVTALIPELGDYPSSHEYMIFSGEDTPAHISIVLQNLRNTNGKTVFELLDMISASLTRLKPDRDGDFNVPDRQIDDDLSEEDDDQDVMLYDSDNDNGGFGDVPRPADSAPKAAFHSTHPVDRVFRSRLRSDLRAAKQAGFKVGVSGYVLDGGNAFITVSVRMSKLGISEEAMRAWQVKPHEYLILVLQYPNGYKTNEELQNLDPLRLAPNLHMRVCSCKKYKPTLQEAIQLYAVPNRADVDNRYASNTLQAGADGGTSSVRETFISRPLADLLQERLVPILRFRRRFGIGWAGAEILYMDRAGAQAWASTNAGVVPDECFQPEPTSPSLPEIAKADHFTSGIESLSFPLLAMQFLIRHFARCTEFCLVCHRKMETDLEAIKPYVCESELCLYQYMTLGFGPSIEHEVLAQPYVVDLLISFCYQSAHARKMKEFPDGLALSVLPIDLLQVPMNPQSSFYRPSLTNEPDSKPQTPRNATRTDNRFEVGFDRARLEVIFFKKPYTCPVRKGDWICLKTEETLDNVELHCRIAETSFFPTLSVNEPVVVFSKSQNTVPVSPRASNEPEQSDTLATPAATPKWAKATFIVYKEDFKSLSHIEKCAAICSLLDTLPDVKTMQEYLVSRHPADFKHWVDRISPAALSLLRWVIASNRACIMQVDGDKDENAAKSDRQDRVSGMNNYMQFRFAMGAPDKEQRFITEVRNTSKRLRLAYPTLFAWHGSPLYNWHMIIREGLHFENLDNGRAYGHGVYHATDCAISTTYTGRTGGGGSMLGSGAWPNSVLQISSAIALNEIVNSPAEFVSSHPYLVVAQLDWIQTRYLFVRCSPTLESIKLPIDEKPVFALQQDPKRPVRGAAGTPIAIPASAVKSRKFAVGKSNSQATDCQSPHKRIKVSSDTSAGLLAEVDASASSPGEPMTIEHDDDDAFSVSTSASDVGVIFGDDLEPAEPPMLSSPPKSGGPPGPPIDFVPDTLDYTTLPLMPLPTYATSSTTTRLLKELNHLQKVQATTPLADLGWHIDTSRIENVYQWIVELHSFSRFEVRGKKLPLATDMTSQDIKSIVLEIRFNKDFPYSPPYVRVIRPRFIGFNQGGGGHIVLGGAMCMELLTNTGWSGVLSMEGVLMQVRMAIASEPFARLDKKGKGDYGVGEAAAGFLRACETHGWEVPTGFKEMAHGVASGMGGQGQLVHESDEGQ